MTTSISRFVTPAPGRCVVGTITATGTATNPTTVSVNETDFKAALEQVLIGISPVSISERPSAPLYEYDNNVNGKTISDIASSKFLNEFKGYLLGAGDQPTVEQLNAKLQSEADAMFAAVQADFKSVPGVTVIKENATGTDVLMSWAPVAIAPDDGSHVYGYANQQDFNKEEAAPLIAPENKTIGQAAKEWELAQSLNQNVQDTVNAGLDFNISWKSSATFGQFVANTVSHEIAHTLGLNESYLNVNGGSIPVDPPNDIMRNGDNSDGDLSFAASNVDLLNAALGNKSNGDTPLDQALALTQKNFFLPTNADPLRPINTGPLLPEIGVMSSGSDVFSDDVVDFGSVGADGVQQSAISLVVQNTGFGELDLSSISLLHGDHGFHIVGTDLSGTNLGQEETATLTLAFDPSTVGAATDQLIISSNSGSLSDIRCEPDWHRHRARAAAGQRRRSK